MFVVLLYIVSCGIFTDKFNELNKDNKKRSIASTAYVDKKVNDAFNNKKEEVVNIPSDNIFDDPPYDIIFSGYYIITSNDNVEHPFKDIKYIKGEICEDNIKNNCLIDNDKILHLDSDNVLKVCDKDTTTGNCYDTVFNTATTKSDYATKYYVDDADTKLLKTIATELYELVVI